MAAVTLALDATYAAGEALTGVGVYSRELLWGLAASHPEARILFCYRPHRFLKALFAPHPVNASRRLLSYSSPPRGARLFHSLNQRLEYPKGRIPSVVTFHDLFVLTGEYSDAAFRARFAAQAKQAAERADLIIAVSEFTAGQIRDLLGVDAGRIRVVHHGVRAATGAAIPPDDAREDLVLNVGAIQRRKNLVRLVEAFEALPSTWRLVLAGSEGWQSAETIARIAASPARDRIEVTGYVSTERLEDLYRRARIFAFPSLDEGFGIPVIEAMSRGVPVLTSNRSALPEAAGGAALLVDPLDTESIGAGLARLATDPNFRDELRRLGLARSAEASWHRAVEATWRVYGELL